MTTGRFNNVKGGGINWKTVKHARSRDRKKAGDEEGNLRRFAQQFVDQIVLLRREGKPAAAEEIIDTLRLANPHLARIVTQEAKGRN